jgi:tetratricopeptide (TPR) repeat protein
MRPTTSNANTDSLLAMAVSHHQAGRLGEAEALYRQTLDLDPTNADALHLLGLVTLTRDPVEATQLIAKALKKVPKNILFLSNLAKAQNAAGENSKAVNTLKRVIKLDPKNDAAMNSLGVLYAGLRDQRKAEYTLRQAIKIRPDHGEYWNNLGLILSASDKKIEAIEALEQGLKIAPDYPVLLNSIGAVHRDMEHLEESINMLEKAIAKAPTYFEAISNLGVSLNDAGRYEAAIEKFEAALELNPEHGETWRGLSKPLMTLGHKARALEACEQAMKLAPGNIVALWERALVNLLSADFATGWSDYRARPMVNRKKWPPPDNPVDPTADLSGRHFVLMGEQGLGEELFFLRFAARLKKCGARITACIDERLVPMVQRLGFVDNTQSKTSPPPKDGEHILIGDLGWFAGWGDVTPPPVAIAALEENAELIRQRLIKAGPGPYTALT